MPMILTPVDLEKLQTAATDINETRKQHIKSSIELNLSSCTAKIYHMASESSSNPTVRIDLKMKEA